MRNILSASKNLVSLVLFFLQFLATLWFDTIMHARLLGNMSKRTKPLKMEMPNVSSSKLLGENMLQNVGYFLYSDSENKIKITSKQWTDVKIYENISPNVREMAVYKHIHVGKISWEETKCKKLQSWETTMPNQELLVSQLRRKDAAKWFGVFAWLVEHVNDLNSKKPVRTAKFLKELMLGIAGNFAVTNQFAGVYPLMLAAAIGDVDSILLLIKRGAFIDQRDRLGWRALHFAAAHRSMNACATLLENNADIDGVDNKGRTPLMVTAAPFAFYENKTMYQFLVEKGANENLTDSDGKTALQLARFQERI
jgi:hypothetical protein